MPRFYIISDIHGFYKEMREALDRAGFDPNDENSWLISLGDEIDRGPDPEGVINYIMSLPRAIWIKGNHQELMEELVARKYPHRYDWSNGTMGTIMDLVPNAKTADGMYDIAYSKVKPFFDKAINYLELKNHILVHSFIPLKYDDNNQAIFNSDWRYAPESEWNLARWGNPYQLAEQGLLPDKTLVFGHFHTSWARCQYDDKPELGADADFSPYYGNGYIGIDACCAYSGKLNCIVIEDEFLED